MEAQKQPPQKEVRSWNFFYLMFALLAVVWINALLTQFKQVQAIPYSEFLSDVDHGKVSKVTLSEDAIYGELKAADGKQKESARFVAVPVQDSTLVDRLTRNGVSFAAEAKNPFLSVLLSWIIPGVIFYLLWTFLFRRMSGLGQGGLFAMTKSKAKVYMEKDVKTRFSDVAGVDEVKAELKEVVDYLREPERYTALGGRNPKGILLVGPPGTGKTLLARAVAGEASVPFFSINGSEFVELFVGLGAARVRDLFEQARKNAPCILFIDEVDALGKSRAFGVAGFSGSDEKEQTLNQLLAEMDGFDASQGVILLAATNRPEILDPALLRAGRFDRQVLVGLPDKEGRAQILNVHIRKIKVREGFNVDSIAGLTSGFSGADLENLVNEAALVATRRKAAAVEEQDFTAAIERLVAGLEQRKKVMSPDEKRRIAAHEMGHAIVGLSLNKRDRIHKISIIPRGIGALGYTLARPTEDRYLMDEEELINKIAVLLGGRASEKLSYNAISTGAADDLTKATEMARAMVTQYGMSERLGLATFEERHAPYLMRGVPLAPEHFTFSEATARSIDHEIKAILDRAYHLALKVLESKRALLEEGVKRLLAEETLSEDEILALWNKFEVPPRDSLELSNFS